MSKYIEIIINFPDGKRRNYYLKRSLTKAVMDSKGIVSVSFCHPDNGEVCVAKLEVDND